MKILDELEAAEKAATPGPWGQSHDSCHIAFRPNSNGSLGDYHFASIHGWKDEATNNGKLIALSRNHIKALIDCARALEMYADRWNWLNGSDGKYGAMAVDYGYAAIKALAKLRDCDSNAER
jgi:hypothetical protein